MTRVRRIVGIVAVGIAVAESAFAATTPASADSVNSQRWSTTSTTAIAPAVSPLAVTASSNTCGRNTDRVRTPRNQPGVVFHPHGDDFEVWNNTSNPRAFPADVWYRYCYPTSNDWHHIYVHTRYTGFPGIRKNMKEYPYRVAFRITTPHDPFGEQVSYRTWGS